MGGRGATLRGQRQRVAPQGTGCEVVPLELGQPVWGEPDAHGGGEPIPGKVLVDGGGQEIPDDLPQALHVDYSSAPVPAGIAPLLLTYPPITR